MFRRGTNRYGAFVGAYSSISFYVGSGATHVVRFGFLCFQARFGNGVVYLAVSPYSSFSHLFFWVLAAGNIGGVFFLLVNINDF